MRYVLCVGVIVCAPLAAIAQDDGETAEQSIDVIDVAGLRPVNSGDVTSSVFTLDLEQLEIRNAPYLADSLRAAPGVAVSRSGALGGLTQVRMRGAEANHTLVLIDGIEVSDPVTGETDFGLWSGLDIARIEVARGEQSALYGSDAIGGVVSVTTGGEGLRGLAEYGSFETARAELAYDGQFDGGYIGAFASGSRTDGVDTSGLGGEEDGSDAWSAALRAGLDFSEDWRLTSLVRFGEATVAFDADTDFDGLLNDVDRETESEQLLAGLSLHGATGLVDHIARASFAQTHRDNFADGAFTDSTTGQRTKISYSPSVKFGSGTVVHTLSGLTEVENEDYERVSLNTAFGDPNQSQSFQTIGFAGEYRLSAGPAALNLSARHDDNDGRFEDATTWRAGAAYSFEFGGKLRASAGQGVKNPTFTELFGFFPGSFIGDPNLQPERSTSWEIGWDQSVFGVANTSVTYFQAELEDEIFTVFNPDFTSSPANRTGESTRKGVEAAGDWALSEAFSLFAAATYTESENDGGQDEIRVPGLTGSVSASWTSQSRDGLTAGLALDYVGEQDDTDFGTFQTVTLDDYVLVSATAAVPITDRLALTLRGENLLDEQVMDVFGASQRGAGVFVGVRVK